MSLESEQASDADLGITERPHPEEKQVVYVCTGCPAFFPSREHQHRHTAWHAEQTLSLLCPDCSESFVRHQDLLVHASSHECAPDYGVVCGNCGGVFASSLARRKHLLRCTLSLQKNRASGVTDPCLQRMLMKSPSSQYQLRSMVEPDDLAFKPLLALIKSARYKWMTEPLNLETALLKVYTVTVAEKKAKRERNPSGLAASKSVGEKPQLPKAAPRRSPSQQPASGDNTRRPTRIQRRPSNAKQLPVRGEVTGGLFGAKEG